MALRAFQRRSKKGAVSTGASREGGERIKRAAAVIAESLESRRLLSFTPAQAVYQWHHLKPGFKHELAILEFEYPQFAEALNAELIPQGITPIAPEAPTASDALVKARNHKPVHRKPVQKPHRPHVASKLHGIPSLLATGPSVISTPTFQYETLPHQLSFQFDEDVSGSLSTSALVVTNLSNSQIVPAVSVSWDAGSKTATFSFSSTSPLPDGKYAATILGTQIVDANGDHLIGDDGIVGHGYTLNFSFLDGDFNHDGNEDWMDEAPIIQHWNQTGVTFDQGDFNYDGTIDNADVTAFLNNFNVSINLPPVTGLIAPQVTDSTIPLLWNPSDDPAETYSVYRGTSPSGESATPITSGIYTSTFTDTGLSPGTSYYYRIQESSYPYHSVPGPELAVVTEATSALPTDYITTAPQSPTNLQASPGSATGSQPDSSITLNWTPSTGSGITYEIDRDGADVGDTSGSSFTDTGLSPEQSYSYAVVAVDTSYNRSAATTAVFQTQPDSTPPTSPTDVIETTNSDGTISITWGIAGDNVGVDHYSVYLFTPDSNGHLTDVLLGTSNTTSFIWNNPTPAAINVRAVDAAGNMSPDTASVESPSISDPGGDEIDQLLNQYIPPEYQQYIYDDLQMADRTLVMYTKTFAPLTYGPWLSGSSTSIEGAATGVGTMVQYRQASGTTDPFSGWELMDGSNTLLQRSPYITEGKFAEYVSAGGQGTQWNYLTDPVWVDLDNSGIFQTGDPVLYNPTGNAIAPGTPASGFEQYFPLNSTTNLFSDTSQTTLYPPQATFDSLYYDLDSVASAFADPASPANAPTRWSIGGVLNELNGGSLVSSTATVDVDTLGNLTISGLPPSFSLQPGDTIKVGNTWIPLYSIYLSPTNPPGTISGIIHDYTGAAVTGQALNIQNWTLVPSEAASSNVPALSYMRGDPSLLGPYFGDSAVFREQFQQIVDVLQILETATPFYLAVDHLNGIYPSVTVPTLSLAPIPTGDIPLTTADDYFGIVPDTDLDGLVQVASNSGVLASDTGSMQFEPNLPTPQAYLPLFTTTYGSVPLQAYLSQGNVGVVAGGNANVGNLDSALMWGGPTANIYGSAYSYSLDTKVQDNLELTVGDNHIQRMSVVRPKGNTVVYDFAWDATTGHFSATGTPDGWNHLNIDRLSTLRDIGSYSFDYKFELTFPSGIVHEFGSASGGTGVLTGVYDANESDSEASLGAQFVPALSWYNLPTNLRSDSGSDNSDSSRYNLTFHWAGGRIAEIDYKSKTSNDIIETHIGYASAIDNTIVSLQKTDGLGNAIAGMSYSISGNTIVNGAMSITRDRAFAPGIANAVTLTSVVDGVQGSREEKYSYNSDGLLVGDEVTLIEPDGTTSSANTTYVYQSQLDYDSQSGATDGRYPDNGQPSWGKVIEVVRPDGSWTGYRYDLSTGWVIKTITPFKSSVSWTPATPLSSDRLGNRVEEYGYDAGISGGDPVDVTQPAQPPRETIDYVNGVEASGEIQRYSASRDDGHKPDGTPDVNDWMAGHMVPSVTSRDLLAGDVTWANTAPLWSQTQILGNGSFTATQGAGFVRSIQNPREIVDNASWGGNWTSELTELLNGFGTSTSLVSEGAGLAVENDSVAPADQGPFGRIKKQTFGSSGLTTGASFSLTGNFWWGPQSTTETDGSTTKYTYTPLGQIATKIVYAGTSHSVETSYLYDAAGNVVLQTTMAVQANGDPVTTIPSVTDTYTYDVQGRLTKEVDNSTGTDITANRTTTYNYSFDVATGLNIEDITYPPTSTDSTMDPVNPTEAIASYLDGTQAYDTGNPNAASGTNAVTPTYYDEGVIASDTTDANGNVETAGSTWTSVTADGSANTTTTYTNMLGEQYLVQKNTFADPGANGNSNPYADALTYYDGNGRPIRSVDFDGVQTLTVYDPMTGQAAASITDMNRDGQYEAGTDLKSIQTPTPLTTNPATPAGQSDSDLNPTGDNKTSQAVSNGGLNSSTTVNGLTTTDVISLPNSSDQYTDKTTNPDGTQFVDTYSDGLLSQEQHLGTDGTTVLTTVSYLYNALRELTSTTDNTGTTQYTYFQDGTQKSVQQPGHTNPQTVTALDLATGDAVKQTRADLNTVTTPETSLGQTAGQSGAGVLAAQYAYDPDTGDMDGYTLNLSNNFANTANNYTAGWRIDPRTGLPDADSINGYTYTNGGQVKATGIPGAKSIGTNLDNADRNTGDPGKWQATGLDELSRAKAILNTDDGKSSYYSENYTAQQQLNEVIWGSAGGTTLNYAYYPTTGAVPAGGSPGALQTLTITSPGEQAPVETGYTYNAVSQRLQTITVNGIDITYTYQPNSDQVQSISTSGVNEVFTPDGSDGARIGEINVQGGDSGTILFDESITSYNAEDQRTGETVSRTNVDDTDHVTSENDTIGYSYDPNQADALTGETVDGQTVASYSYDGAGERVGGIVDHAYEFQPYPTINDGYTYTNTTYDSAGNEIDDGSTTYAYDDVNRLQSATPQNPQTGSLQAKFGYDNQNRLLWEDVNQYNADSQTWTLSYSRKFVWDGMNIIEMLDANNTLLQSYAYGPTGLAEITSYPSDPANPNPSAGATTYIPIKDASGNIVELVNALTGTVGASYHYGPFGENFTATGPAKNVSPFAEASGYRDPVTGLYYFVNRWLNALQGRFMTPDPTGVNGGFDYYDYAKNDPINYSDTSGLAAEQASPWHHLLSKKVFDPADKTSYLNQWGMKLAPDVDIHSAEWGWEVPADYHNPVLHSNRNALEATWQRSDRAWLDALRREGRTTITTEMLKAHVEGLKTSYGLIDEAGNALQGRAASEAWKGASDYLSGLAQKGNLVLKGIRNSALRTAVQNRLQRAGAVLPEMLPHLVMAVAIYLDLTEVVNSDVPVQTAIQKVSAWHGAFAGGELGGAVGEMGGPIGSIVGALVGGIGGYLFGEQAIKNAVPLRSMAQEREQLGNYMDAHGIPKASEAEYGPMAWFIDAARVAADAKRAEGSSGPDDPELSH